MQMHIKLAGAPRQQPGPRPEWPLIRLDGFLLDFKGSGSLAEPAALIQLVSNGRIGCPLPDWRENDIVTLEPFMACVWGDPEETGRCYLDLYIRATCVGRRGQVDGLIPYNPNFYDFTREAEV
jgi:hypothetical protein